MNININANIYLLGPYPICDAPIHFLPEAQHFTMKLLMFLCQTLNCVNVTSIFSIFKRFLKIHQIVRFIVSKIFIQYNVLQRGWPYKNLTNLSAFYPVGTFLHMFKYWVGLNQSNFCDNFLFLCKSGAFLYVRFTDEFLDNFSKQQCSQLRHPGLDGRSPEIELVFVRSVKAYCASH